MFKQSAPRPQPRQWTQAALQALARASVMGAPVRLSDHSIRPPRPGRPETREANYNKENTMAIAYLREFDAGADRSTKNYDAISARLRLDDDRARA